MDNLVPCGAGAFVNMRGFKLSRGACLGGRDFAAPAVGGFAGVGAFVLTVVDAGLGGGETLRDSDCSLTGCEGTGG